MSFIKIAFFYKIRIFVFLLFFFIHSCNSIEISEITQFNYDDFSKIIISADSKKLNQEYSPIVNDFYIDYSLEVSPSNHIYNWFENNIKIVGSDNSFKLNIIDASLKKTEIPNESLEKYKEETIFLYELSFFVEFLLYDDFGNILTNIVVENKSRLTSGKFVSLIESEKLINELIFNSFEEFTKKSKELIYIHMNNYVI